MKTTGMTADRLFLLNSIQAALLQRMLSLCNCLLGEMRAAKNVTLLLGAASFCDMLLLIEEYLPTCGDRYFGDQIKY